MIFVLASPPETFIFKTMSRAALYFGLFLAPSLLGACTESPSDPLESTACGDLPNGYLERSTLTSGSDSWFYRRTIVGDNDHFAGFGDLTRARLAIDADKLSVRAESDGRELASWTIRAVDLECGADARYVESEAAPLEQRKLIVVDWSTREGPTAIGAGVELTKSAELADWRRESSNYLEITEHGELTADLEYCAAFIGGVLPPERCGGETQLRHALMKSSHTYESKNSASVPFMFDRTNSGLLHRVAVDRQTYYLSPEAPSLVPYADLEREFKAILPNFSIRANTCSIDGLNAAIGANPALAEILEAPVNELRGATLIATCNLFERTAPKDFRWQRPGELRVNTITWLEPTAALGWGSYAARAVDHSTGEIVASDLFLNRAFVTAAAEAVRGVISDDDPAPEALLAAAEKRAVEMIAARYQLTEERRAAIETNASDTISTQAALARLARVDNSPVADFVDDNTVAWMLLGPEYFSGPIPDVLRAMVTPRARAEYMLDTSRREEAVRLLGAGYDFLDSLGHPGYEAAALEFYMLPGNEAGELVFTQLGSHMILHGLGHALGLADNPAASSDLLNFSATYWDGVLEHATASVMDILPGHRQLDVTALGRYDQAALRFLYLHEIAVFDAPPPDLRFGGGEAIRSASLANRRFVPFDSAPVDRLVPFASCDLQTALTRPTPSCAALDFGANAREVFANSYARWLGEYHFTNIVGEPGIFNVEHAFRPAINVLNVGSVVVQWLGHYLTSEPFFRGSAREQEFFDVANNLANFATEVLATPARGTLCGWPGAQPPIYLPSDFLNGVCDTTIEVPAGLSRDFLVHRENDNSPWSRVGSKVDRLHTLLAINFPFPTDLPDGARRVTLQGAVPVVETMVAQIFQAPAWFISVRDVSARSSTWCQDGEGGFIETRRAIAEDGEMFPGASDNCPNPASVYGGTPGELAPAALVTWFAGLDAEMRIYVVGQDDEDVDWVMIPPEQRCSAVVADNTEYRAIRSDSNLECQMVELLYESYADYLGHPTNQLFEMYLFQKKMVDGARALRVMYAD